MLGRRLGCSFRRIWTSPKETKHVERWQNVPLKFLQFFGQVRCKNKHQLSSKDKRPKYIKKISRKNMSFIYDENSNMTEELFASIYLDLWRDKSRRVRKNWWGYMGGSSSSTWNDNAQKLVKYNVNSLFLEEDYSRLPDELRQLTGSFQARCWPLLSIPEIITPSKKIPEYRTNLHRYWFKLTTELVRTAKRSVDHQKEILSQAIWEVGNDTYNCLDKSEILLDNGQNPRQVRGHGDLYCMIKWLGIWHNSKITKLTWLMEL